MLHNDTEKQRGQRFRHFRNSSLFHDEFKLLPVHGGGGGGGRNIFLGTFADFLHYVAFTVKVIHAEKLHIVLSWKCPHKQCSYFDFL